MAVQDTHTEYKKYYKQWCVMRDVAEGQEAVHGAGVKYLPMLGEQPTEEYNAYKMRALFYGATGRTINGLTGMIFRKPPSIETEGMTEFIEDVTLDNDSLRAFAENITKEVMTVGRVGVLVEYPIANTEGMTQAQAEAMNMRPYFHKYQAKQIHNWRTARINNKMVLSEVRLHETVEVQTEEFEYEYIDQLRVLDLDDGVYRVRLYRKGSEQYDLFDTQYPMSNGANMGYIPFVFFSSEGTQADIVKPPLIDIANINLSHYLSTADLEHGAHFTGLPTAFVRGIDTSDNQEYKIGSTVAWAFTSKDADAKYLEFTGQGLTALVERLSAKESQMASLGAQMLTPDSRRNESTETAGMRHMGENSILANISQAISEGLNRCLEIAGEWMGIAPAVVDLNRDFMPTPMTPQMMASLVSTWQMGAISTETLFNNLKEGEIIEHDKDFDEEQDEIQNGALTLNAT